ncbi:hypothetical protein Cgig2_031132 [Carnegiea gigantea]|uniref:Uncharacterized protein n=1 Tax=Carnegiea gigantea TaxID=171969 RepID=A0A9Q1JJK9_9CARY|nr:hypothetical protein Cgig2_031132 [Carnegiea gigantea]
MARGRRGCPRLDHSRRPATIAGKAPPTVTGYGSVSASGVQLSEIAQHHPGPTTRSQQQLLARTPLPASPLLDGPGSLPEPPVCGSGPGITSIPQLAVAIQIPGTLDPTIDRQRLPVPEISATSLGPAPATLPPDAPGATIPHHLGPNSSEFLQLEALNSRPPEPVLGGSLSIAQSPAAGTSRTSERGPLPPPTNVAHACSRPNQVSAHPSEPQAPSVQSHVQGASNGSASSP